LYTKTATQKPSTTSAEEPTKNVLTEQVLLNLGYTFNPLFNRSQSMNLRGMNFTDIDEYAFANFTSVRFLDLSNNRLTSLPQGVFSNLSELRELRLHTLF
jgi:hypothetical protein